MFGIEFRNGNNNLIIQEGELPLQYWGKKIITTTNNTDSHELFNLPATFPCSIYVLVTSGASNSRLFLVDIAGKWKVQATANATATYEIYVFTSPMLMPKADYGIELYGTQEEVIFNGQRPPLSIDKIAECFVDPAPNNNIYSPLSQELYKVAVSPVLVWRKALPTGQFSFLMRDYYITCFFSNGVWKHGIAERDMAIVATALSYGTAIRMQYGLLNAAYYDQFSSLSNYA